MAVCHTCLRTLPVALTRDAQGAELQCVACLTRSKPRFYPPYGTPRYPSQPSPSAGAGWVPFTAGPVSGSPGASWSFSNAIPHLYGWGEHPVDALLPQRLARWPDSAGVTWGPILSVPPGVHKDDLTAYWLKCLNCGLLTESTWETDAGLLAKAMIDHLRADHLRADHLTGGAPARLLLADHACWWSLTLLMAEPDEPAPVDIRWQEIL